MTKAKPMKRALRLPRLFAALSLAVVFAGCRGQDTAVVSQQSVVAQNKALCADPKYSQSPLPPPTGFVNDFAGVIDRETRERLEDVLARLRERAKVEFAVVTVKTTSGVSVFDYSLAVACGWGVGPRSDEGGGMVLLVAVDDRQWRFQVGRRLEEDFPESVVDAINVRMREHFSGGRYGAGVETGVNEVVRRLAERRGFILDEGANTNQTTGKVKP